MSTASVDLGPDTPLLGADKKSDRRTRCMMGFCVLVVLAAVAVVVCWSLGVFDTAGADGTVEDEEVFTETMELHLLTDSSIKCNDGSAPGYYLRRSPASTNWVVLFAGGNCCWDNNSCKDRYSSSQHAEEMKGPVEEEILGGGISSSNSSENPYMHDWNNVYVHYCTSDDWLGTVERTTDEGWWMDINFHGAKIVTAVYDDLIAYHGMDTATRIVHAGYSVGGLGVYQWFDRVYERLTDDVPAAEIYGFSDSGWWLYNESYHDYITAPYSTIFPSMWSNFEPSLHPDCVADGLANLCYHGEFVYPYIEHADRLFISQQIFDKIHANSEGFLLGSTYEGDPWPYAEADRYVATLASVPNLFATDCRNHDIINSEDWTILKIDGYSLADAFNNWLSGQTVRLIDDECMTEDCNPSCTRIDPLECFFFHIHCE